MSEPKRGWTDQQVEQFLGGLLRWGVLLAAAVVLAGGILHLVQNATVMPDFERFRSEPAELNTIRGIVTNVSTLDGKEVIQFGLLLLIAVPVARVAFSVLAFVLQRDRDYVLVTLAVLAVLLVSLFAL